MKGWKGRSRACGLVRKDSGSLGGGEDYCSAFTCG